MADEILQRDQNHVTVLAGITNDIFQEIRMFRVDPSTGAVLVSGTGGGGGGSTNGLDFETPTGSVNGSNVTFTVSNTPLYIITDNQTYFENEGYTISGSTVTMDAAPFNYIRSAFASTGNLAFEAPPEAPDGSRTTF